MLSGHWDAYGIGPADARGDTIRNGAHDDGLGIAGVLEIARVFAAGPRPERTLLFAAWTGEERGLLGSEYYALHPLYPAETMVANITLDTLQSAGPARDVILIEQGQSDLEDPMARMAAEPGPDRHARRPAPARPLLPRRPFPARQTRRPGAAADGAGRRRRPGQRRPRGGRPLGQRLHRPLLPPGLRRMVAQLGSARRRPGRQPWPIGSGANSPIRARGRRGARVRSSAPCASNRRNGDGRGLAGGADQLSSDTVHWGSAKYALFSSFLFAPGFWARRRSLKAQKADTPPPRQGGRRTESRSSMRGTFAGPSRSSAAPQCQHPDSATPYRAGGGRLCRTARRRARRRSARPFRAAGIDRQPRPLDERPGRQ